MTDDQRMLANLEKLLRLANADADALRIDLADVERARRSTEASLQGMEDTVRREQEMMKDAGVVDLAAYLEGMRERRLNLQTTLMTLSEAEEATRDRLEAAFVEIKKLEHVIDLNKLAAKKARGRQEVRAADDLGASRLRA